MAAIKDQQSQQETFSIVSLCSSVCIYIYSIYVSIHLYVCMMRCMYDDMYDSVCMIMYSMYSLICTLSMKCVYIIHDLFVSLTMLGG